MRPVGVEIAWASSNWKSNRGGIELSSWLCQSQSMFCAWKLVAMWHIQSDVCEMINCNFCTSVTVFLLKRDLTQLWRFCFQVTVSLHGFSHSNLHEDFAVDMRVRLAEAHWAAAEKNNFWAIVHPLSENRSTSPLNTDVTYMETKRSWLRKCENERHPKYIYKETEFDVRKRNTAE